MSPEIRDWLSDRIRTKSSTEDAEENSPNKIYTAIEHNNEIQRDDKKGYDGGDRPN